MKGSENQRFYSGLILLLTATGLLIASIYGSLVLKEWMFLTCFGGSILGAGICGSGFIDQANGKTYTISYFKENQEIEVSNLNNDQAGLDNITAVIKIRHNKTYVLVLKRSDVSEGHLKSKCRYIKRGDTLYELK